MNIDDLVKLGFWYRGDGTYVFGYNAIGTPSLMKYKWKERESFGGITTYEEFYFYDFKLEEIPTIDQLRNIVTLYELDRL